MTADRQSGGSPESDRGPDWDPVTFDSATPPAEWALAAVGAVFALLIVGLLVVQAVRDPDVPPQLSAHVTHVTGQADAHVVEGGITNTGGAAAANVQIEGQLLVDGQVAEEAAVQVDYVPAGATETFLLVFSSDPADGRLVLRPTGFVEQ